MFRTGSSCTAPVLLCAYLAYDPLTTYHNYVLVGFCYLHASVKVDNLAVNRSFRALPRFVETRGGVVSNLACVHQEHDILNRSRRERCARRRFGTGRGETIDRLISVVTSGIPFVLSIASPMYGTIHILRSTAPYIFFENVCLCPSTLLTRANSLR